MKRYIPALYPYAAVLLVMVFLIGGPRTASAYSNNLRATGWLSYTANSITGGNANWTIPNYTAPDCASDRSAFTDQTIWLQTNGGSPSNQVPWWVETGNTYGAVNGGACGYYLYWAQSLGSGNYTEYMVTTPLSPSPGSNYTYKIDHTSGGQWTVLIGGYSVGNSTNNPGPSNGLEQGIELSYDNTPGQAPHVLVQQLQWRDNAFNGTGNWHSWCNCASASIAPNTVNNSSYFFSYDYGGICNNDYHSCDMNGKF